MIVGADKKRLQLLIDCTVTACSDFHRANTVLMEFCRERYGCEPGDIDADSIIDTVLGGCGVPSGMSAEDFDRIMLEGATQKDQPND